MTIDAPVSTTYDILVIGSGSAGAAAALRIAKGGLRVLLIEKTDCLGGTSAMSGGGVWIPANHVAKACGIADSPAEALTYLRSASPQTWATDEDLHWKAFAEAAPRTLEFIERATPLRFELVGEPDPYSEHPGGKSFGRMLTPLPLSRNLLGRFSRHLRRSTLVHLFTYKELVDLDPYHHPVRATFRIFLKLVWRWLSNSGGQGTALMIGLLKGCLDAGCEVMLGTRATRLIVDEAGRVAGVMAERQGETITLSARRGVVLASGGFEWNQELLRRHFPGRVERIGSPRSNEGDGQIMAAQIGAKLARMDQANIYPCLPTIYEGKPHGLPITFQSEPHSIIVNQRGMRFVNENGLNLGEALDEREPETGLPRHASVWLVGDRRFLKRSWVFRWYASYDPNWVIKAPSIEALARKIAVPPEALEKTVDRFNTFCDAGRDDDHHRGKSIWDSYKAHQDTFGRIEMPPFMAVSVNRSILGTKGGARTNERGEVLRLNGTVIPGLYAAGLAMANPIGTRAVGAGTTLGPNMTWGMICAETILSAEPTVSGLSVPK
jgi:3-oxosteroid 1-dehydrogenase